MPLSLLYSGILHILVFSLLFFCMQGQSQNKKKQTTYTIDFIGSSSTPMRYGAPKEQAGGAAQAQVKQTEQPKQAQKEQIEAPKKETKKAYNAEAQITKEKQKTSAKNSAKNATEQEEKVVLSKPSILKDVETSNIDVSGHNLTDGSGAPGERAVQASFTNFPYPWYITQVRNKLWTSWQKLMPKKTIGLSVVVSFNVDKHGAIYGVQIDKSSNNDDFDYKGKVAVLNSAPYPPLPQDYSKEILTVSVEFKNEE